MILTDSETIRHKQLQATHSDQMFSYGGQPHQQKKNENNRFFWLQSQEALIKK
jgi:hypothetical protein